MFDVPRAEIPGRLSFGPRPRSAAEVAGIDLVVNLLTDVEISELNLHWLEARRLPIEDRHCPPDRARLDRASDRGGSPPARGRTCPHSLSGWHRSSRLGDGLPGHSLGRRPRGLGKAEPRPWR